MATDEEAISLSDLSREASATHHSLGLLWEVKIKIFTYSVSPDKKLLATVEFSLVNGVFDPIGFLDPVSFSRQSPSEGINSK